MNAKDLDIWWASLTTTEKERIATKAARKAGDETAIVHYPACTAWWISIDPDKREKIYKHCTDDHGLLLEEWKEGKIFSY